jgi:hypothetical protein
VLVHRVPPGQRLVVVCCGENKSVGIRIWERLSVVCCGKKGKGKDGGVGSGRLESGDGVEVKMGCSRVFLCMQSARHDATVYDIPRPTVLFSE